MQRQILMPLLPGQKKAGSAITATTLLTLHDAFMACGYQLVPALLDSSPLPAELWENESCADLLCRAVNPALLEGTDLQEFCAMLALTDLNLNSLDRLDSVVDLQSAIGHCFSDSKVICVLHPAGMQVINPRYVEDLRNAHQLQENLLPKQLGLQAAVTLMVELMSLQFNHLQRHDQRTERRLQGLMAQMADSASRR